MISFILIAVLITVTCLAILVRPLLSRNNDDVITRDAQNIHYAKTRLTELSEQLASNKINQSDYDDLKLEIETSLVQDINLGNSTNTQQSTDKSSNAVAITLVCTLIPFAALVLYQLTGTPAALDPSNLSNQQASLAPNSAEGQDINQMIATVEQRLQENPNDSQGWAILSRTYMVMQRYQESYNASLKLLELNGESAAVYTQLADASALLAGGVFTGQPSDYIKKALAIDPQYPQALWLAGLDAAQLGNVNQANEYWNTLLPLLANSPKQQQELRNIMQQTVGAQPDEGIAKPDGNTDATGSTEPVSQSLTVNVSIDPAIISQSSPTDFVFVFARAQSGPPAPLAVKRLTVADLPTQIQLSDDDAMIEQFKLSLFEDVSVIARISKSGNPIAQSGDIQSNAVNTKNNADDKISLVISEIVEK